MIGFIVAALLGHVLCVHALTVSPLTHLHPELDIVKQWSEQMKWQEKHQTKNISEALESVPKYLIWDADNQSCGENCSVCTELIVQFGVDFARRKSYTLEAIDADGKPQSGVFKGNIRWNGRYYECSKIRSEIFNGKWCDINFGSQTQILNEGTRLGMSLGLCVPDACSEEYLNKRLEPLAMKSGTKIYAICPVQPRSWSAPDIISLTVFCTFSALVALGTAADLFTNSMDEEVTTASIVAYGLYFQKYGRFQKWVQAIVCFSIIKNTKALLSTERRPHSIESLHGIRFLSIAWVLLGHSYVMPMLYVENFMDVTKWYTNAISFQIVANGVYSVDTFFFISGLLVTYLGLNEMARRDGKLNVLKMYLQRYLRLTPPYAVAILFIVGIFGKLGDGPMWPDAVNGEKCACQVYWWTNLLYINNLYPSTMLSECFVLGWYLANDMQFFLLAPISIFLLYRRPKIGIYLLLFGVLSSVLVTGILSAHYQQLPQAVLISDLIRKLSTGINSSFPGNLGLPAVSTTETFWGDVYAKPWCRIAVYLIGMLTGYILYATNRRLKMTKLFVACGWMVALLLSFAVMFGLWTYISTDRQMPISLAAFYNAMCRVVWGLAVAWVVIACAAGYGGPVNTFLSWRLFTPLSKLTYSLYLVHSLVILWWHSTEEVTINFTNKQFAFFYVGTLGISIAVAYVFSMLFEAPIIGLMKFVATCREETHDTPTNSPLTSEEDPSELEASG